MTPQTNFRAALLAPDLPTPAGLTNPDGAHATKRFDVYRNNVVVSLTEALESSFPVIAKLLGDANFAPIAREFLRQNPPSSPVMTAYGAAFPEFLANFPPIQHLGYLADIAKLEIALRQSYHAADANSIAPETLQSIAPERLTDLHMEFSPAMCVLQSPWPIFDIWAFNMLKDQPNPRAEAQDVLILRAEFDPEPHLLEQGGAVCVNALLNGKSLGDALELATEINPEFNFGALLGLLLSQGAITKITLPEDMT